LRDACGPSDAALVRVASKLARGPARADHVDVDSLAYDLRAAGAPYVWPRAWRFDGPERKLDDVKARLQAWLASFGDGSLRRCGVARR
jgi:hypothetical protein